MNRFIEFLVSVILRMLVESQILQRLRRFRFPVKGERLSVNDTGSLELGF
jgi:hypothetical protein